MHNNVKKYLILEYILLEFKLTFKIKYDVKHILLELKLNASS